MNIDFKLSVMILNFWNATVFCCLNLPALVIGCAFSWLLCPFDVLPLMIFFEAFCTFWHYKTLQAHFVYPDPVLKSAIFPRSRCSFYWRIELETRIWALGVLTAASALLILIYMYIYILIFVYTHIYTYVSVSVLS